MDPTTARSRSARTIAFGLILLCTVLLAGETVANAARPARPVAKAPAGVTHFGTCVTFKWMKAERATNYQVQVWIGKMNRLARVSSWVRGTSWTSDSLDSYYDYTWRVRARNRSGTSSWSRLLPYFRVDDSLEATWEYFESAAGGTQGRTIWMIFNDDSARTYRCESRSTIPSRLGVLKEKGKWRATATSISLSSRRETWIPGAGDQSGIAAYSGKELGNTRRGFILEDWDYSYPLEKMVWKSLTLTLPSGTQLKFWRDSPVTD
jgi:hypothetical protein